MLVEKIAKKDAKNVVIYFSDGEPLFLSLEVFLKSGLKKNDEISDDRFSSLISENKLFFIKQRALRYLGRRLHSRSELRVKLLQKGYEINLINEALEYLAKKNYLDDAEFAWQFTKDKLELKGWSKAKSLAALIKRGINPAVIDEVMSETYTEKSELENATTAAQKKLKSLRVKSDDKNEIRNKLSSFLSLRGYDYEIVKEVCDKLISSEDFQ